MGGNRTVVHRVGSSVRRMTGTHSRAVHTLLDHLQQAGFEYSPRFLGIDDQGREKLSYLEGTAGNYPIPPEVRSREAMETAVTILRQLHDATVGLRLPEGHADHLPEGLRAEAVCHWDAAPYNFVFSGTRAIGIIDFDEAGPGRRIDDLAYFAYRFAPLCSPDNFSDGGWSADIDQFDRLKRIFELYPDPRASLLPEILIDRLGAMKRAILARIEAAEPGTATRTAAEHIDIYTRDQIYIRENSEAIIAAIR